MTSDRPTSLEQSFYWLLLAVGVGAVILFGLEVHRGQHSAAPTDSVFAEAWELIGGKHQDITLDEVTQDPTRLLRARALIERGLRDNPNSSRGHLYRGIHQIVMGDLDGASASLNRSLELQPNSLQTLLNLGVLHFHRQDFAEAEKFLRRATQVAPNSSPALYNLSQALWRQGKQDEALTLMRILEGRRQNRLAGPLLEGSEAASPEVSEAPATGQP